MSMRPYEEAKAKYTFDYQEIQADELSSTGLRKEVALCSSSAIAVRIRVLKGEQEEAERAEGIYDHQSGRMGIVWTGDASWADVESIEAGIEMYLNNGEEWSSRN